MPRATKADQELVRALMANTKWPWAELKKVIEIESGWDPSALEPKWGASGLLQWMPFNLKRWKLKPKQVRRMNVAEQAPLVRRWFDEREAEGKKWRVPGDTYLAVAAPHFVGAPDDRVIYRRGSKAWRDNPLWRPRGGGSITAGSIRRVLGFRVERRVKRDRTRALLPVAKGGLAIGGLGAILLVMVAILASDTQSGRL